MLGRTNIIANGGSGGVTTVDLPTPLASIAARAGQKMAYIDLTYSSTALLSGVELRYKAGSYPSSPSDGTGITTAGSPATITVPDLDFGNTYYFRAYPYREINGVKYYQTSTVNATASVPIIAVSVSGVTPARQGSNYLVIDKSATFTITGYTPVTLYVVGGGGGAGIGSKYRTRGGYGGHVVKCDITLSGEVSCTTTIAAAGTSYDSNPRSLIKINGTQYSSGTKPSGGSLTHVTGGYPGGGGGQDGSDGVLTPYGYVGSSGGAGALYTDGYDYDKSVYHPAGTGGTGAGSGGDAGAWYANDGGNAWNYGCGGGGSGNACYVTETDPNDEYDGTQGKGMQGCVIITWEI